MEKVTQLQAYVGHLLKLRQPFAEIWDSIRAVARPTRGWQTSSLDRPEAQAGDLVSPDVMDNAAGRAIRILTAGLHSGLTPPSRAWFALRIQDEDLMEYAPVKNWLYRVETLLYDAYARSNFYPSIHAVYGDLSAFCSGCLAMESVSGKGMRFHDVPIGDFVWDGDAWGNIKSLARYVRFSAQELVSLYGDKVHRNTAEVAKKNPYASVSTIHVVMPRPYAERLPGRLDRKNKAFASYLFETSTNHMIDEGGMDFFPYLCARWDACSGEIYGRGTGFDALPDVRMLQSVSRDQSMAIRLSVLPPMKVPASMKGMPLHLIPGAKNYVSDQQFERIAPLYEARPDIAAVSAKIMDLRVAIREGFFNDLFLMLTATDKTMTAYEVAERNAEKLLMLGPVIERHQTDMLDPCISSTYRDLEAMGAIPEAPGELAGADIKIEFISVLAQAQQISKGVAIRKILTDAAGMAQSGFADALDKIDSDKAVDRLAAIEGVPPDVIRSAEDVAKIREERAKAQASQQMMEQMRALGEQANAEMQTLGNMKTGPGTALGDMLGGDSARPQ